MAFTLERIFPTENDVGGLGKGRVYEESNTSPLFKHLAPNNYIETGFSWVLAGGTLTINNGGVAVIEGERMVISGTHVETTSASTWWFLFMSITKVGGKFANFTITHTTSTAAINSQESQVMIFEGRTGSGGNISHLWERGPRRGGICRGTFNTALGSPGPPDDVIALGFSPVYSVYRETNGFTTNHVLYDSADVHTYGFVVANKGGSYFAV